LERLNEEELKSYRAYREIIKYEPLAANCSINRHLRTLVSFKWNAKGAAKGVVNAIQFRIDNKLAETTLEMIKLPLELGFFKAAGNDKWGRPLIWFRCGLIDPSILTKDICVKFSVYSLDFAVSQM
jgi:hypothetical protein